MTAREDIRHDLTRPKVRGVHWSPDGADMILDAYRAEVLRDAADAITGACPDRTAPRESSMVCHCDAADLLRRMAGNGTEAGEQS